MIECSLICLGKLSIGIPGQEVIQPVLLRRGQGAMGQRLEFVLTQADQELRVWWGETSQLLLFFQVEQHTNALTLFVDDIPPCIRHHIPLFPKGILRCIIAYAVSRTLDATMLPDTDMTSQGGWNVGTHDEGSVLARCARV